MITEEYKPRLGGSRQGRRKSKPRQRMEGYCMLYANYFTDDILATSSDLLYKVINSCFKHQENKAN
jgi:hypothetical protein